MRFGPSILLLVATLLASGALLGFDPASPVNGPTARVVSKVDGQRLACLTNRRIAAIRARPTQLRRVFAKCKRELRHKIPFARPGVEQHAALASLVAYRMAPYGPSSAVLLRPLLEAEALDCDNYGWLTFHLVRRAWSEREALRLRRAGWDHGAVGNHAQLQVRNLLLDPTIAVVARIRYRQVREGVPARRIVAFSRRADIESFGTRVVDALADGRYRPSDVLYWTDYANWRAYR